MTMKNDWLVVADDVRPARPDGTCFYCGARLGDQHRMGCVIRTKTVVVDVTVRYVRKVPEDWGPDMVEFHMNDSSSCTDNLLSEIEDIDIPEGRCSCNQVTGKFVREASAEDEENLGYPQPPSRP